MIKIENVEVTGWDAAIPISGYENYRVDKHGNIYNFKKQLLKQYKSNNGYMRVSLSKHQKHKKFLVHRLVALAFIPNPNNLPQVHHKDENKENNNADNLEWCTCIDNLKYSNVIDKASTKKYKKVICLTTNEVFNSIKDACIKYNLHHSNIVACCNERRESAGGMEWSYQI